MEGKRRDIVVAGIAGGYLLRVKTMLSTSSSPARASVSGKTRMAWRAVSQNVWASSRVRWMPLDWKTSSRACTHPSTSYPEEGGGGGGEREQTLAASPSQPKRRAIMGPSSGNSSQAYSTGAVARPRARSAVAGLPSCSLLAV